MSDTDFRKKLAGRDAGVELQMVVEDLLSRFVHSCFSCAKYNVHSWNTESSPANDNESLLVEKADIITTNQPQPERYLPRYSFKELIHFINIFS